jgi:FMN phosphatase YigB (HAD superfamily)
MKYRTVVFDIGNVLCSFDLKRTLRAWVPFVPGGVELIQRVVPPLKERVESGQIGTRAFIEGTMASLGFTGTEADFCRGWVEIFDAIEGSHEFVRELAGRVRLLILSNTNELHWEYLRATYSVFGSFEGYVVSHEAGLAKPDALIYRHLAEKYGIDPREAFFIDDLEENVRAAEREGFGVFRFDYRDDSHLGAVRSLIL